MPSMNGSPQPSTQAWHVLTLQQPLIPIQRPTPFAQGVKSTMDLSMSKVTRSTLHQISPASPPAQQPAPAAEPRPPLLPSPFWKAAPKQKDPFLEERKLIC